MRKALQSLENLRCTFTGTFVQIDTKASSGYTKQTVLLIDIEDSDGKRVTDHLWLNLTKGFSELGLMTGDTIRFEARVKRYIRGYQGRRDQVFTTSVETDYKLSYPTRFEKLP